MQSKLDWEKINKIDGWLSREVAELLYRLSLNVKPGSCIVELGSWKGRSSLCLAQAAKQNGVLVYCVDPHIGSQEHQFQFGKELNTFAEFSTNLKPYLVDSTVLAIQKFSTDAISDIQHSVGFLWVDASHEFKDVKADFDNYFPLLSQNSWIAFHDCKWPGVRDFLWQYLFSRKDVGPILRIEDTIYCSIKRPRSIWAYAFNYLHLKYWQASHLIKTKKRKFRKKIKKLIS